MLRRLPGLIASTIRRIDVQSYAGIRTMGSSNCKSYSPSKVSGGSAQKTVAADKMSDYIEGIVCKDGDVKENEMKSFDLGEGKVLMVRQGGVLHAIGSKCSHYGAPLASGALGQGRVRCPWHGACFNIKTGDIEDFPGLDSIPCYGVTVLPDGQVKVRAKKSLLETNRQPTDLLKCTPSDGTTYVVVGGGPSAAACAESLRKYGCSGKIVMITKEDALPYDRIKISKALDSNPTKLQLRDDEFYAKNKIDVIKGDEVVRVDSNVKSVTLKSGSQLTYDYLYLATGSTARKLDLPGSDLKNIFTLRTCDDGNSIYSQLGPDKHVVILGVSFIGMEAAAYCAGKVKSITMIGRDDVPFQTVFGRDIGASIMKLFVDKGVEFKLKNNIKSCNGNGRIESVTLSDDSVIPADVLIMGVGATFNTEFLKSSGVELNPNGSVPVSDRLATNAEGVYAGGDIAHAPVYSHGTTAAIGHFGLAHYHGKTAALNMLNVDTELKSVPFFWTMLFGKSIRYCGHGRFARIQIDGDVNELKFVAFYFDDKDNVTAMASCQRDPIVAQYAEYLAQGKTLRSSDLETDLYGWVKNVAC